MEKEQSYYVIPLLSWPLALILLYTSSIGLFTPDFYQKETANWQLQSIGQDRIDLYMIVPVLVLSSWFAWRKNNKGILVWAGTNLYLVYTFSIFCFDVHFNKLFIFYCINLGLSFYSLMYFIWLLYRESMKIYLSNPLMIRITGFYFILIALIFYSVWLSEIVPAVFNKTIPENLTEVGLPTNPVHVIDLSVFLPGLLFAGLLLLRRSQAGFILAPVLLVFFILMDITIVTLTAMMHPVGLDTEAPAAMVIAFLALVSLGLLLLYFNQMKKIISQV
jgi:hypothetical protein